MGTFYSYHSSQNEFILDLASQYGLTTHKVVKGILYGVLPDGKGIAVLKLDLEGAKKGEYGYKPMHEKDSPYYWDVPKSFLKLPVLPEHRNDEWRKICQQKG